jgi:hypothetical protein
MSIRKLSALLPGLFLLGASPGYSNLEDGLVARWLFNEQTGGAIHDSSPSAFHGTLQGGTWTGGQFLYDGAVAFDGLDNKVVIPGPGATPPPAIGALTTGCIAIRFRFPATGSGDIIPLFYFGESEPGTPHNSLIVEIGHANNANNRRLYFTIINARFCYDSGVNLLPDTWYHYVAVVGANGNTGYLDGQEMIGRHYNLGSDATYTDFFSSVPVRELLSIAYGLFLLPLDLQRLVPGQLGPRAGPRQAGGSRGDQHR